MLREWTYPRPREISRASGDVFPNTSLLSAVYGYNPSDIYISYILSFSCTRFGRDVNLQINGKFNDLIGDIPGSGPQGKSKIFMKISKSIVLEIRRIKLCSYNKIDSSKVVIYLNNQQCQLQTSFENHLQAIEI